MQNTALRRDRLKSLLPRLQARWAEVNTAEQHSAWATRYDAARPVTDALAAELRETYPAVAARLIDLLARSQAADAAMRAACDARPMNYHGAERPMVPRSCGHRTLVRMCKAEAAAGNTGLLPITPLPGSNTGSIGGRIDAGQALRVGDLRTPHPAAERGEVKLDSDGRVGVRAAKWISSPAPCGVAGRYSAARCSAEGNRCCCDAQRCPAAGCRPSRA
jgi:hypothetical protein